MIEREVKDSNLHLTYRQDLDILFLRWFKQADSSQLRKGYLHSLEMAKEVDGAYWMLDLRSLGNTSCEDEAWMLNTYFPQVEETLPHPCYYASLVTPTQFAHIRDNIGLELLDQYGNLTKLGIFLAEQEAVAWLLQCRANR